MNQYLKKGLIALAVATFLWGQEALADFVTFGSGGSTFEMTFVEIGDAGNAADPTNTGIASTPAGSVSYNYQMGKYEVSEDMISKFNASQSLQVTTSAVGANKSATMVSWNEPSRFVNSLNTSEGHQAAYNFTTGGVNDNIALWDSADAWQQGGENRYRHKDAQYWLPSMDEWYKAAYYDPGTGNYFDYATASNSQPAAVSSGDGTGANGNNEAVWDNRSSGPADVTQAGGLSPNGIMGMSGNVFEWEETSENLSNSSATLDRVIRGGSYNSAGNPTLVSSNFRAGRSPTSEIVFVGFRVASAAAVPEPGSIAVWSVMWVGGCFCRRRRARK